MNTNSYLSIASIAFLALVILAPLHVSAQNSPDGKVIAELRKAGSNLRKPHPIEFFFYLPTPSGALQIASELRKSGYDVIVRRSVIGDEWAVKATRTMVPVESELAKLRIRFEAMATEERGQYDGWGTRIVE